MLTTFQMALMRITRMEIKAALGGRRTSCKQEINGMSFVRRHYEFCVEYTDGGFHISVASIVER